MIFSGQKLGGFFDDTWAYELARREWRQLDPGGQGPSKRYGSCAAYDVSGDRFYISHGFTDKGRFDDNWAFDLATDKWIEVSSEGNRPVPRCLHQCAFDVASGSLLLFGGQSNVTPILGDLWRFDPEDGRGRRRRPQTAGHRPGSSPPFRPILLRTAFCSSGEPGPRGLPATCGPTLKTWAGTSSAPSVRQTQDRATPPLS